VLRVMLHKLVHVVLRNVNDDGAEAGGHRFLLLDAEVVKAAPLFLANYTAYLLN